MLIFKFKVKFDKTGEKGGKCDSIQAAGSVTTVFKIYSPQ